MLTQTMFKVVAGGGNINLIILEKYILRLFPSDCGL